MALEGSIKDFGLADILQLIYFQRKTGILSLDGNTDKVKLYFVEGNITGAESRRRSDDNRLGKILVKRGLIRDEDLKAVLEEQRRTGAKLGAVLIQKELVEREKIKDILNGQITETVAQLFAWKQGTYAFAAQGVPQDKEFPFSLDTQHLLMEGLRIVDELSVIKDKITLDSLFVKKSDDTTELSAEEKDIFSYVDAENDVSTIIDLAGMDSYEVSKILLALLDKGFIEPVEAAPVMAAAFPVERKSPSALKYIPYIAVAASLILSLAMVLLQKDNTLKSYKAAGMIRGMRFDIEAYKLKNSVYPPSLSAISGDPDPWGRPYSYTAEENAFSLRSTGPDGSEGTSDDVF